MLYRINNGERKIVTVAQLQQGINELASPPMEYDPNDFKEAIKRDYALIELAKDPMKVYEVNGRYQLITK